MISTQRGDTKRRTGFSMIELLMVMVIISLTAAWALPKFSIARYRADAAGRLVRTQLSTAQRLAITRQSDVIVSFDITYNRLRVVQDYNNNDTLNTGDIINYRGLEEGAKFVTPAWPGPNGTTPTAPFVGAGDLHAALRDDGAPFRARRIGGDVVLATGYLSAIAEKPGAVRVFVRDRKVVVDVPVLRTDADLSTTRAHG